MCIAEGASCHFVEFKRHKTVAEGVNEQIISLLPGTALTCTLSTGPLLHSALLGMVVPVLKTYGLILAPTSSRRETIWSWCYTQGTIPKKIILLMPRLHGLGHEHNNYYITVLQQEELINKRKKSTQRLPQ